MDNFVQAADINIMSFSDDDDLRLFKSRDDPELARKILRVKHNDPEVKRLDLDTDVVGLSERARWRLGDILGQNTNVEELMLWCFSLDGVWLGAGLQKNRCIQKFELVGIDFQDNANMTSLAPFLSHNPSLKNVTLVACNLGPSSINILSNALSNRLEDTLEYLDLCGNHIGDIELDELCLALSRSRKLSSLGLMNNGIGLKGCTSLAKLLVNQDSNLTYLHLDINSIDDESAVILADSLAKNKKLEYLTLKGNNAIATAGWSSILKLVCNSSIINNTMNSNHDLFHLGMPAADLEKAAGHALGVENVNLLCASLKLNAENKKMWVTMRRII